jgi:uncharacterized protein DUF4124
MRPFATFRCAAVASWCVAIALAAAPAQAEICKYVDGDGNIHYSNVPPGKGFRKLSCTLGDDTPVKRAPAAGVPARNAAATPSPSTPAGFPRIDAETQKGRDDVRRKVLGDELAAEEKLLVEARAAYSDGAPQPLPEEKADAERYRQRIGRLRQSVSLHEKNIEAIKKELATIK